MRGCLAAILGLLSLGAAAGSLTFRSGTSFSADLAPDRAAIVMDLQGHLWTLPAAGGVARALTDGMGDDRLPRFSPDGHRIAFQTFRDGGWHIAVMAAEGGPVRLLTSGDADDREPAWLPDGQHVVFASDRAGSLDIWQAGLDGTAPVRLTDDPADDYAPAVAPDGAVVFISDRGGKPALYLREPGGATRLLYAGHGGRLAGPVFSPDGSDVLFVAAEEELNFPGMAVQRLLRLPRTGGEPVTLTAPGEDVFPFPPAWRDAGSILYTADGGLRVMQPLPDSPAVAVPFAATLQLQSVAPTTRRLRLPEGRAEVVRGIVGPVVAPDGSGVVFTALGDLWLRGPRGDLKRLTAGSFVERDAAFTRDGRRLAYISDRSGSMQVWMRDWANGSDSQLSRSPTGVRNPTWSPDGRLLAFQQAGPRGDQDFRVQLLDVATGSVRALNTPPLWADRMSFTGDGRHLLVAALQSPSRRYRDGINRLLSIDIESGSTATLALPPGFLPDAGALVSPAGDAAAIAADGSLWLVTLTPAGTALGAPRRIVAELADYPAWSPDAGRLVFVRPAGLTEVAVASGQRRGLPMALHWRAQEGSGRTIVHAGRLFDGVHAGWRDDMDVVIEAGRITAVRPHGPAEKGARVIEAGSEALLPGLIDAHAHHQAQDGEWVGRAWLAFGVTSVIEPGGLPYESRENLESWASGARPGPRLFIAGPQLDGARRYFPFAVHVMTPRRLDQELDRARVLDYAMLKTYTRMPPALQERAIAAARARRLVISSHDIYPAFALGGDRVEHLRGTSRLGFSPKQSDLLNSYEDMTGIVGGSGAVICPTLVVGGGFFTFFLRHPELDALPQYTALYPASYRQGLRGFSQLVARHDALLARGVANAGRALLALREKGARIVAGTDSPIFPYGLALVAELQGYVDAGFTPAEALMTATSASAQAYGLGGQLGVVQPGARADLILVAGDPLKTPADLLTLTGVIHAGRYEALGDLLRGPAGAAAPGAGGLGERPWAPEED